MASHDKMPTASVGNVKRNPDGLVSPNSPPPHAFGPGAAFRQRGHQNPAPATGDTNPTQNSARFDDDTLATQANRATQSDTHFFAHYYL